MARISMPALIALGMVACLCAPVSATFISLSGAPISLHDLGDGQFTAGDKVFSDFEAFAFAQGGAIAPDANAIFIQAGQDSDTGDYGLRFLTALLAGSGQFVNLNLSYMVEVAENSDDHIDGVRFKLLSPSTTGGGLIGGSEYLSDGQGGFLGLLEVSKQAGDGAMYICDWEEFDPVRVVRVESKDITVSGGAMGLAHLSEFHQYFQQVPEPVSLALLAAGGVALLRRRRR